VGPGIGRPDAARLLEVRANLLYLGPVPEAVEHHVHAGARKGAGDAEADAAGRSGDDGRPAGEVVPVSLDHGGSSVSCPAGDPMGAVSVAEMPVGFGFHAERLWRGRRDGGPPTAPGATRPRCR